MPPPISQKTILPFTSIPNLPKLPHHIKRNSTYLSSQHKQEVILLKGSCYVGKERNSPSICSPFPRFAVATILLSRVLAPTVRIHGASLDNVMLKGPEFPAAQLTNIPFCMAANEPMETLSSKNGTESPPRESESTSTPSWTAASVVKQSSNATEKWARQ